jgi:hypothetical protein
MAHHVGAFLCVVQDAFGRRLQASGRSGTDHVEFGTRRHHAGSTPSGRQAAARLQALAALRSVGELDEVDPVEALQVAVNLAHARPAHLHSRVGDAA